MGRRSLNQPRSEREGEAQTVRRLGRGNVALWIAWAVGMSPVVAIAPTWLAERPESLYVVFAPLLLLWEAARAHRADPGPRRGWGLLVVLTALPTLLLGLETGSPTLGLGGAALAFIGVALFTGLPPLSVAVLALWIVPVPVFVLDRLSPGLETIWMDAVIPIARGLGVELVQTGPVAFGRGETRVEFFPVDDGLLLAHGMALVGYFHARRRGEPPLVCVRRSLVWMGLGFVLQGAVLLVALLATNRGDVEGVRHALVHGPTMLIALGIVVAIAIDTIATRRGSDRPDASPP